ncbi:hypothetical protein B0G77_5781 [Paraburkholderia sp. BL10I2N1]|nr:hypothetical protein B0G77_5781 [Paraburkholderia sp. BL10I2N1]
MHVEYTKIPQGQSATNCHENAILHLLGNDYTESDM